MQLICFYVNIPSVSPKKFYKSEQLNTYLLRTGNMLFSVSEIKIKYAHEKPVGTKKFQFQKAVNKYY